MTKNIYLEALDLVKKHSGTSGQNALAKCILSLYKHYHAFGIGDILAHLDQNYTRVVLALVTEYAKHGETAELRQAGEYCYDNFPGLIESLQTGMTLRDYFAAKALSVAFEKAVHNFRIDIGEGVLIRADHIADSAYDIADAMLEARKK